MNNELNELIQEGEYLKGKALSHAGDSSSESENIDKIHDEVEDWIKRTKGVLASQGINNIDLDDTSWDSIMSNSYEALGGFIEERLKKLRPLFYDQKTSMTYDKIMTTLLQAYEAHPEMKVEEIIAQVAQEMGTSEKGLENIKISSELLDNFQEKKMALEAAHEDGETTKKWILSETARMTENRTDEEKALIAKDIVKAVNNGVEQSLTEGQNSKED